jgi:hypothetical protein
MVDAVRACYAARIPRSPAIMRACHFGRRALLVAVVALAASLATDDGVKGERVSHRQHAMQPPAPPPAKTRTNVHLAPAGTIALPGHGLSLAWSPDGARLAVGGHFRDKATRLRYDTRIADVAAGRLVKSFACHWFWSVSQAWVVHPNYGPVLADGGGDMRSTSGTRTGGAARPVIPGSS